MTGFKNEKQIINELNSKDFTNLSKDLQNGIIKINKGKIPLNISAKKYGGTDKADLSLTIDNIEYFISVKKGTGNSVHQESVEDFIKFLKLNFVDDESVFDDLRSFIWGDKTLNGNGKINNRISASKYKKEYPDKIENIQLYFDNHKKMLLERFLITGAVSNKKADFLFYGNIDKCTIVSDDDLLKFALKKKKKPISIGVLTFQAWNRNINGGNLSEHKRGQIQLKWGGLKEDIKNI